MIEPKEARLVFRDQLRAARAAAAADAEGFQEILFAVERLGSYMTGSTGTLQAYRSKLTELVRTCGAGAPNRACHIPFSRLYESVMTARNEALHQGAYARHLTAHVAELALYLEEALMNGSVTIGDFMVRNPTCASLWQPLGFVRQQMLANAFSFLPIRGDLGEWRLLSDLGLARYLRVKAEERKLRLAESVRGAIGSGGVVLEPATHTAADTPVEALLASFGPKPMLVTLDGSPSAELVGILTPFDLL